MSADDNQIGSGGEMQADNIVARCTKDCEREDCSISGGAYGFSTCMGWTPTYDKHGNRTDRGDPNTHTTSMRCASCGKQWAITTQYGETTVKETQSEPAWAYSGPYTLTTDRQA